MMKKMMYEKPTLEILSVACEQGFSLSGEVTVPDGGENNNGGEDNWA